MLQSETTKRKYLFKKGAAKERKMRPRSGKQEIFENPPINSEYRDWIQELPDCVDGPVLHRSYVVAAGLTRNISSSQFSAPLLMVNPTVR